METYTSKKQIGDKVFAVLQPVGNSLTHPMKEVEIDEVYVTERAVPAYRRTEEESRITEEYAGFYYEGYDRKDISLRYVDWFDTKEEAKAKQAELREELKAERERELQWEKESKEDAIRKKYNEAKAEAERLGIELN